jgi:hypothetical protein
LRRKTRAITIFLALIIALSFIQFQNAIIPASSSSTSGLEVSVSAEPSRIQEGNNTTITIKIQAEPDKTYTFGVNVTSPAGTSSAINVTIKTNATGYGENATDYWKDFPANTDYVGLYSVKVLDETTQEVLVTTGFTVGLTDKLKYSRGENVTIQGSGYKPKENVTVNIKLHEDEIVDKYLLADDEGIVNFNWTIPANAIPGNYTVNITGAVDGTEKSPPDVQSFYVEVWQVQIQASNIANKPVANLIIEAVNQTWVPDEFSGLKQSTNKTGWASFMLAIGNYTFVGFWKGVPVGNYSAIVKEDKEVEPANWVQLLNLKVTVLDEGTHAPIPFVQLKFTYNYTYGLDKTKNETNYYETDLNGTAYVPNLFINSTYVIEARRYGFLSLSSPPIQNKATLEKREITIVFPVYKTFVYVTDAAEEPVKGISVEAYEWSSGLIQKKKTDSDGKVTFSLTLGRYIIRVYNSTVLLNQTIVNLNRTMSLPISLSLYNINFTVAAFDYFGQSIPYARVKIEQKIDAEYKETTPPGVTGPDGQATFSNVLGGNSRISVYIKGQLGGVRNVYITNSKKVVFHLTNYVVFAGYALEASQFATAVALSVIIVIFAVALTYKRLLKIFRRGK